MADILLLVLGPVRLITSDGKPLGRLSTKSKALLAYLASQPDGCAERAMLSQLLWDHGSQKVGRHCLRQTLLNLRSQLGSYADLVLKSHRDSLELRLDVLDVDLSSFEAAVRSRDDNDLAAVSRLWRGPFCDGLDVGVEPFEEWLLMERARLDDLAVAAFKRVAQAEWSAGRLELALDAAQRCVALNPFDDAAQSTLISLYREGGSIGSARAAYRRCVELFQAELGEAPDKMVQTALTGKQIGHACQPECPPSFAKQNRGDPSTPEPELRVLPGRLLPMAVQRALGAALSATLILAVIFLFHPFTGGEDALPQQELSPRSWVSYAEDDTMAIDQDLAKASVKGDVQTAGSDEKGSSYSEPTTTLAYLFPLGC